MKHWERIAGKDIKPGDKITWGNQIFYGEVRRVSGGTVFWVPGSFKYTDNDKQMGDLHALDLVVRRDIHKLVEVSEYDPSQQPYTDGDI